MNLVEEKRKNNFSNANKQMISELSKKINKFNFKNLLDKMHKLIVKKLKLNVNCHMKISRNHNFLQI
jgi:hypothetical protein